MRTGDGIRLWTLASLALLLAGGFAAAHAQPWRGPVTLGIEVLDGQENPVSGAEVRLEYAEVEPYTGPPPLTTDAAGRAEVYGLAEGLWRVQVDREGFSRYLVVLRLDPGKKKVLITAGPLRDATAPPLEVSFVKTESRVAGGREPRRGDDGRAAKKERDKVRKKDRERSGRISESEPERVPEPPTRPPVRTVPDEESRPEPAPPEVTRPTPEPETPATQTARMAEPRPAEARPPEPVEAEPERVETVPPAPEPTPETLAARPSPPAPEPAMEPVHEPVPEPPAPSPSPTRPPEPTSRRAPDAERPPRPAEDTVPPPAASDVRTYQAGTCSDCKPGEAATSAVAAAGKGSGGGCPAGVLSAAEGVLEALAAAMTPSPYTGPLAIGGQVAALAPEAARTAAQTALAPQLRPDSPCQLLVVVLAPSVKFSGYRYEARQGNRGGDCLAGQDCPIGGARWPDHPAIRRTARATFVYTVFENRSDAERVAEMTVYFDPTP